MRDITAKPYRFQVAAFDHETNSHIEQHRKEALKRKRSTLTPISKTLVEVVQQNLPRTSQLKAA